MSEDSFSTKREVPRYPFIAEAEVAGLANGTRLAARVSEFSLRGCYVDTLNPFPLDTELRLRIRHGDKTCDLPGKVIYVHPGFGMGILFGSAPSEQVKVLEEWLAELATAAR